MDRFALCELKGMIPHLHRLALGTYQVQLHASMLFFVLGAMLESLKIEIGSDPLIEMCKQVEIELFCKAPLVVICGIDKSRGFLGIDTYH